VHIYVYLAKIVPLCAKVRVRIRYYS
jgi:hypothetical protein